MMLGSTINTIKRVIIPPMVVPTNKMVMRHYAIIPPIKTQVDNLEKKSISIRFQSQEKLIKDFILKELEEFEENCEKADCDEIALNIKKIFYTSHLYDDQYRGQKQSLVCQIFNDAYKKNPEKFKDICAERIAKIINPKFTSNANFGFNSKAKNPNSESAKWVFELLMGFRHSKEFPEGEFYIYVTLDEQVNIPKEFKKISGHQKNDDIIVFKKGNKTYWGTDVKTTSFKGAKFLAEKKVLVSTGNLSESDKLDIKTKNKSYLEKTDSEILEENNIADEKINKFFSTLDIKHLKSIEGPENYTLECQEVLKTE